MVRQGTWLIYIYMSYIYKHAVNYQNYKIKWSILLKFFSIVELGFLVYFLTFFW